MMVSRIELLFFSSFLQSKTEFQAQAALATICRETAVYAFSEEEGV
jgi:hypothetical protein